MGINPWPDVMVHLLLAIDPANGYSSNTRVTVMGWDFSVLDNAQPNSRGVPCLTEITQAWYSPGTPLFSFSLGTPNIWVFLILIIIIATTTIYVFKKFKSLQHWKILVVSFFRNTQFKEIKTPLFLLNLHYFLGNGTQLVSWSPCSFL